jgi:hypothetical protein
MQPQQPYGPPPEQSPVPEPPVAPAPPPVQAPPKPENYQSIPPVESNYEFIMGANQLKKPTKLRGSSTISRLVIALVGLIFLVILFAVFKGILSGNKPIDTAALINVAQDQQAIIHLLNNAQAVPSVTSLLTTGNQNFIITGQLSIRNEQAVLLNYLKANGNTVSPNELTLKINSQIDKELTASLTADTYEATFTQVIQNELATYQQDLTTAYQNDKTAEAHSLLKGDYNAAKLLQEQFNSTLG